ncbi:MAG TPA: S8 family serine peptidase, partial [Candidatus Saccharimonadales bacterium]|nr:S8 family serine peptidase [Candidatus Saccharimonadales bacterium]
MMRKTLGFGGLAAVAALAGFMAWPGRPALISGGSFVMPFHSVRTTDATAAIHKASGPAGTQSGNEQAGVAASDPASVQVAPETTSNTPAKDKLINLAGKQYPVRTYKPLALPNDPLLSGWWINQTRLPESWDIAPGAKQATLAIIDTGFALAHEEFAGRWHVNGGEKGSAATEGASARNCSDRSLPLNASCNLIDDDGDGTTDNETGPATYENPSRLNCTDQAVPLDKSCNRQDDDGNGYVDDLSGWDFNSNDEAPLAGELNPNGTGTTHGTRVAGLAAATGNNAKGIAGVDWQTRILPLQALDDDSYGDTLSVGRAMYYAIAQGADVISLSLGSDLPDEYVRGAVRAALKAGIVVVAASGNDGCDCVVYPANYPEVLAVGALDSTEQVASFSSYGKNVDVLAPGVNVTSTNWQSANRTSAYASGLSGTSFATPMIAGALSRLKSLQPAATPAQLIAAVTENVNRLGLSV